MVSLPPERRKPDMVRVKPSSVAVQPSRTPRLLAIAVGLLLAAPLAGRQDKKDVSSPCRATISTRRPRGTPTTERLEP